MTKQKLLDAFITIKNNLTLSWTLLHLLERNEYYEIITKELAHMNPSVPALLENLVTHKKQIKYYYFTTALLNTIRECLEITKEYCCQNRRSHNYKKFYDSDTITFARYIRNCITHEFKFAFKTKQDIDRVTNNPPKWKSKIIDFSLNGKDFDKTFMSHQDLVDLLNDLDSTIKNEIN